MERRKSKNTWMLFIYFLPSPALAHGGGLYLLFVGIPMTAAIYLITMTLLMAYLKKIKGEMFDKKSYVLFSLFILPLWIIAFFFLSAFILDNIKTNLNSEENVALLVALLAPIAAFLFGFAVSRKPSTQSDP